MIDFRKFFKTHGKDALRRLISLIKNSDVPADTDAESDTALNSVKGSPKASESRVSIIKLIIAKSGLLTPGNEGRSSAAVSIVVIALLILILLCLPDDVFAFASPVYSG